MTEQTKRAARKPPWLLAKLPSPPSALSTPQYEQPDRYREFGTVQVLGNLDESSLLISGGDGDAGQYF